MAANITVRNDFITADITTMSDSSDDDCKIFICPNVKLLCLYVYRVSFQSFYGTGSKQSIAGISFYTLLFIMKYFILLISWLAFFFMIGNFVSCRGFFNKPFRYTEPQKNWAWKPVYAMDTSFRIISYQAARPVVNAGKIYVKDNLIYQSETGAGIHITDNTNPAAAKRTGFINVPGSEEISIKGNVLYTNNYYDLIAIDISNITNPQIISRTKNAFFSSSSMPHTWEQPKDTGYYQCPNIYMDSVIVNWVKDSVFAYCYK